MINEAHSAAEARAATIYPQSKIDRMHRKSSRSRWSKTTAEIEPAHYLQKPQLEALMSGDAADAADSVRNVAHRVTRNVTWRSGANVAP